MKITKSAYIFTIVFSVAALALLVITFAGNSSGIFEAETAKLDGAARLVESDGSASENNYIVFGDAGNENAAGLSDQYSYRVNSNFSAEKNLPNSETRQLHEDWWAYQGLPDRIYEDTPEDVFAAGDLKDSNRNGSYSYARAGSSYLADIVNMVRVSGDPEALDLLVKWSEQLATNLKDHDGRGFTFFEYMNAQFGSGYDQAYDPKYEFTDTNFLDEQMLAGTIALVAHALHENRDVDTQAAQQADLWFDYLANNWTPKWLARSTVNDKEPYLPPEELGLVNAVGWDHPQNPRHDDRASSFNPLREKDNKGKHAWTPADEDGDNYMRKVV